MYNNHPLLFLFPVSPKHFVIIVTKECQIIAISNQ
jgi:hypothetical protein